MEVDNKAMMLPNKLPSKRQRERKAAEEARYGAGDYVEIDRREDGLVKSKRMRELEAAVDARAPKSVGRRTTRGKG